MRVDLTAYGLHCFQVMNSADSLTAHCEIRLSVWQLFVTNGVDIFQPNLEVAPESSTG